MDFSKLEKICDLMNTYGLLSVKVDGIEIVKDSQGSPSIPVALEDFEKPQPTAEPETPSDYDIFKTLTNL